MGSLIFGFSKMALSRSRESNISISISHHGMSPSYLTGWYINVLRGCKISHSNVPQLFQVLGLDFLLGNDEMWPLLLGLSGVAALLQFFLLLLCPESPRYLYIKLGKVEEAKKSKTHILGLSGVVFTLYIVLNTEGTARLRAHTCNWV